MMIRWFSAALIALILALAPEPAAAQAAGGADIQVTAGDLESLVRTIQDDGERDKLLTQLKALIAARAAPAAPEAEHGVGSRLVSAALARLRGASEQFAAAARTFRNAPAAWNWVEAQFIDPGLRAAWLKLVFKLILLGLVGAVAGGVVRWLLGRPRQAVEEREADGFWLRLLLLVVRTLIDVMPLAAFVAAAYLVLPLTEPSPRTRIVVIAALEAYLLFGLVAVVARALLAPRVARLRIAAIADETANYLFLWSRRFAGVWVVGVFLAETFSQVGLPDAGSRLTLAVIGLLLLAMAVMFVLQNRAVFGAYLRGAAGAGKRPFAGLRNRFADIWHALAIIYLVLIYGIWLLRIEGGFEFILRATVMTVAVVVVAQLLVSAARRAVDKGFTLKAEIKARYPTLEARTNRYLPVLHTILRWVVAIVAALTILGVWGVDVPGLLESDRGVRILSSAVSIAIVLVAALVVWEGASAAIERYLDRANGEAVDTTRRARARTLLPLLRNALLVVIVVLVALVVLSELGVNIAPLLAGAGVAGLAIGFGAQKLVQDVITGAFILFEDAIAVGDVVRVSGVAGRVEALSIRSIRLRDLSGNVHTIPFSAVDTVTNMTKDFSYYVFEVGVAYRENVDEVIEVLKEIGAGLQEDPDFGPKIMEPLEVLGVDAFADSAVIIKARFKTVPLEQWSVGREFNRCMKNTFDERGIEIPFPHRTLYMGELKDGSAPPLNLRTASEDGDG